MRKSLIYVLIVAFAWGSVCPNSIQASELILPVPGTMVPLSLSFHPPILKGIKVFTDNPFKFDFILDQGSENQSQSGDISRRDVSSSLLPNELELNVKAPEGTKQTPRSNKLSDQQLKLESAKLIKYFLAALTTPEKDLWVNLSPYEKDRIVPDSFGQTEMGRDLLAQDYLLKQVTASLVYPEGDIGKVFWNKVYEAARSQPGDMSPKETCPQAGCQANKGLSGKASQVNTESLTVNTFNKVWIVPNKAVVYENAKAGTAYVVESSLKVMLEEDYLAIEKNHSQPGDISRRDVLPSRLPSNKGLNLKASQGESRPQAQTSQIIRDIVIPQLTKEVNEGANFAQLRQVYNSLILATWYKKKIKESILSQVYADKNKVAGILSSSNASIGDPKEIYQRYLEAFKKGAYNYIKEEQDPITKKMIPRKYFSGGINATNFSSQAMVVTNDDAMIGNVPAGQVISVEIKNSILDSAMQTDKGNFNLFNTSPRNIIGASNYLLLGRRHASSNFVSDLNIEVGKLRSGYISQEQLQAFLEKYLIKMQGILQTGLSFREWIRVHQAEIPAIGVELSKEDLELAIKGMDAMLINVNTLCQAFWPNDVKRMADAMEMALYGAVLSAVKHNFIDKSKLVPLEKKEFKDAYMATGQKSEEDRLKINALREGFMTDKILELPKEAIIDIGPAHISGIGNKLKEKGISFVAAVLENNGDSAQLSLDDIQKKWNKLLELFKIGSNIELPNYSQDLTGLMEKIQHERMSGEKGELISVINELNLTMMGHGTSRGNSLEVALNILQSGKLIHQIGDIQYGNLQMMGSMLGPRDDGTGLFIPKRLVPPFINREDGVVEVSLDEFQYLVFSQANANIVRANPVSLPYRLKIYSYRELAEKLKKDAREADMAQASLLEQISPKNLMDLANFLKMKIADLKSTEFQIFEPEFPSQDSNVLAYKFKNTDGLESSIYVKKSNKDYYFDQEQRIFTGISALDLGPEFLYVTGKNSKPILITKGIEGESWLSVFKRTDGQGITLEMVEQLGQALGRLHRAGFIHGDLIAGEKPLRLEHIFLTKNGTVKFIDFDRGARVPITSAWYEDKGVLKALQDRLKGILTAVDIEQAFQKGYQSKDHAQLHQSADIRENARKFFESIKNFDYRDDLSNAFILRLLSSYEPRYLEIKKGIEFQPEAQKDVVAFARVLLEFWNNEKVPLWKKSLKEYRGDVFTSLAVVVADQYFITLNIGRNVYEWFYSFLSVATPQEKFNALTELLKNNIVHLRAKGMHPEEEVDGFHIFDLESIFGTETRRGLIAEVLKTYKELEKSGQLNNSAIKSKLLEMLILTLDPLIHDPNKINSSEKRKYFRNAIKMLGLPDDTKISSPEFKTVAFEYKRTSYNKSIQILKTSAIEAGFSQNEFMALLFEAFSKRDLMLGALDRRNLLLNNSVALKKLKEMRLRYAVAIERILPELAKAFDDVSDINREISRAEDSAQIEDYAMKGGIDFNAEKMNLETQNAGESIKFEMNPAMLKQLHDAPGFMPVIINIQPMTNLRLFLGLPQK